MSYKECADGERNHPRTEHNMTYQARNEINRLAYQYEGWIHASIVSDMMDRDFDWAEAVAVADMATGAITI